MKILSDENIKKYCERLGNNVIQWLKNQMSAQKEVTGGAYPALKPNTIAAKRKKGKGAGSNAEKRMIFSQDFMNYAFRFKTTLTNVGGAIKFYFSDLPHKITKTLAARSRFETNKAKGKSSKKGKAEFSKVSYEFIADKQLRGTWNNHRSKNNQGADFMGLPQKELTNQIKIITPEMSREAKANITASIREAWEMSIK